MLPGVVLGTLVVTAVSLTTVVWSMVAIVDLGVVVPFEDVRDMGGATVGDAIGAGDM